ncbi:kelch-like protein 3 [Montipora capricornis]|uniref:kelch-like protein 3 n=1 Tax=Montipora capricornis TaxID=246305 RepID=UPI0035F1A804
MKRNLGKRKYKDSEFPGDFLLFLNETRSTGEHCDVHLCVEDCVFPVHRVVLAASCTYFRAMFSPSSCFIEASNSEVCLKNVDKEAVREVLNYFYTGEFQLRISNLENVVILADMWNVPFLLHSIEDFIQRRIHVSNCLSLQSLLKKYQTFSSSIQEEVEDFVLDNFMAVCKEDEFLSLPADSVCELFENDCLRVKSEEMVFEAALRWIGHDSSYRKQFIPNLFEKVRFELISSSYLTERLLTEDFTQQNSDCKAFVLQVLQSGGLDSEVCPRKRKIDALYIIGGCRINSRHNSSPVYHVEYLDCEWGEVFLKRSKVQIHSCYTEVFGHFIYYASVTNQGQVSRINMVSLECEEIKESFVNSPRAHVGLTDSLDWTYQFACSSCACQQSMYIIGGDSCRKFHTVLNVWQELPLPKYQHYWPVVCSLIDKVYVIGGCDKNYQQAIHHVERLDTVNKTWETLSPLPTARWGAGGTVMNGKIYVAGGYDTGKDCPLDTVEVYNPESDTWPSVASLVHPRQHLGTAVVNGVIYVAGGSNEYSVEWYNEEGDKWNVLEQVYVNRHHFACLALPVPHCW